ncbi:MAG: hypothetical protein JW849_00560 [Phycisphaerae bacterium]|nr:hypothetical protein [Phycisphaerae bacterium]
MNVDQNQFEQYLSDSLDAISQSAPAAPRAEQIFRRLRRRKIRRVGGVVTVLVLLACGLSTLVFHRISQPVPTETIVVQAPIRIEAARNARAQPARPWRIPAMKLTALSSPSLKVQDGLTADIPVSSITAGTQGASPNIPTRFVTPRVSLPKL